MSIHGANQRSSAHPEERERARRWRLILGKDASERSKEDDGEYEEPIGTEPDDAEGQKGGEGEEEDVSATDTGELSADDRTLDRALDALYGSGNDGGLGDSAPELARWLGDIRKYFSQPVAQMMQQDALKKANLRRLLNEPDVWQEIEPDLELVSKLLSLSRLMPTETKETAKKIVRQVVEELTEQLEFPLRQAIQGSINRALRAPRPRLKEINWQRTVYANLKHYQPQQKTIVAEKFIGYGKQRNSLRDVILCLDQSGSMGKSIVYGSIFGAIMASIPALNTRLVAFSTDVVDLTDELSDPVDLLFGIQLRGGTDIQKALRYCESVVTRPRETILLLISDLFEGRGKEAMLRRTASLVDSGVQVIVLLALSDDGTPRFNRTVAQQMADLGVPCFACTPALFPDLMGAAINGQEMSQWAAANNIVIAPKN